MAPSVNEGDYPLLYETPAIIPAVLDDMANPAWEDAPFRILIVRLSRYADITKSSSHLFLFSESRQAMPGAFLDFAFLPERRDRETLLEKGLPWFFGRASGRSPADFDLILISNAFALELLNLPWLFSTAGLPLRASGRAGLAHSPFVILGGSNAALAGSLVFDEGGPEEDSFVDAIFFGEGEGAIAEILEATAESAGRQEALEALAGIAGLWIPGKPPAGPAERESRPRRRIIRPAPPALTDYPILNSEEAGTARLAITAGCPGLCSFCLEGWDRLPYREIPLSEVLDSARKLRTASGAETLEVYSFNFNTHASVFELFFELGRIFRRVNFMSQRVDILARTPGLAAAEFAADKHSFTLGIEGISERMRRYYRKGLDAADIKAALDRLLSPGLRELKLFFIIAGIEDAADIAEFGDFVSSLAALKSARSAGTRLLVSAGFLVRLPFTPLQYAPLELDQGKLEGLARRLAGLCEAKGVEFRIASRFDEYAMDQVLALGGSPLAGWLESVPGKGFSYDSSLSRGAWPSLESWAHGGGFLAESFLDEKGPDFRPPLGFMEAPERHALLRRHYEEARNGVDRPLCLGSGCSDCGACADPEDRKSIAAHRNARLADSSLVTKTARLVAAKNAFIPLRIAVNLPESLSGSSPEYKGSWFLRRLSEVHPEAWKMVFQARESLFSAGKLSGLLPERAGFWGKCVFELYGPDREAIARLVSALRTRHAGPEGIEGFRVGAPERPCAEPASRIDLRIAIGDAGFAAKALPAFRRWLSELHVEATEEATVEKDTLQRIFRPSSRGLKKGLVHEARICVKEGKAIADLICGPKARIGEWLDMIDPLAATAASIQVREWE